MTTQKKYLLLVILMLVALLLFSGCAAQNPMTDTPSEENGKVSGFFSGIWDGLITVPAFIINLIGGKGGAFYNVFNNGGWYNFGFILGVSCFGEGIGIFMKSSRR